MPKVMDILKYFVCRKGHKRYGEGILLYKHLAQVRFRYQDISRANQSYTDFAVKEVKIILSVEI